MTGSAQPPPFELAGPPSGVHLGFWRRRRGAGAERGGRPDHESVSPHLHCVVGRGETLDASAAHRCGRARPSSPSPRCYSVRRVLGPGWLDVFKRAKGAGARDIDSSTPPAVGFRAAAPRWPPRAGGSPAQPAARERGGGSLSRLHPTWIGFELLPELRRQHLRMPVIVVTGNVEPEIARLVRSKGAFGYLQKPVDLRPLDDLLVAAIPARAWRCRGHSTH